MFESCTINDVIRKIAEIKKLSIGKQVFTNFFNYGIEKEKLEIDIDVLTLDGTLVFGFKDNLVYRIYFYSNNQDLLAKGLSLFQNTGVLDIITKDRNNLREIIEKSGYSEYAIFRRAINPKLNERLVLNIPVEMMEKYSDKYGKFADIADLDDVYETICRIFDSYTCHIEGKQSIEKLISKRCVLLEEKNNTIISLLVFKIEGNKFYINFVYNSPESKPEIIHSILMKAMKAAMTTGVNYAYCWIDENNQRSIRFHKRYGFEFDGLMDVIYIKK